MSPPYRGEPYDEAYYHGGVPPNIMRVEAYHNYPDGGADLPGGGVEFVRSWITDLEASVGSVSGLRVLDAGCAYGYLTDELALNGATVTGLDISAWAIAQAQALFPARDFQQADIFANGFGNNEFDLIVACGLIECMEDNTQVVALLQEFRRILKPAGQIYALIDYNRTSPSPTYINLTAGEWQVALVGLPGSWTINTEDIGHLPLYYGTRLVAS